ncbi:multiprotein-bridging factor 1 family protein [uncultured Alsobacter sp.]|uniref:helix-turn-helix domain-containing protein n=1 Tax=uncultured Alsobacter sp. TaxID=1748258 RepID=UPI00345D8BC3
MNTYSSDIERISAQQIRAARAWLGWSQSDLAEHARVGRKTIAVMESELSVPYDRTLRDIRAAFEEAGIVFLFQDTQATGIMVRK